MRYALLISNDETAALSAAERSRREAAFSWFVDELGTRGVLVYDGRLHGTETATTVRCWDGGDVNITSGPPAESSEQLLASWSSTARTWTRRSRWRQPSRPPGTARSR